MSRDFFLLNRCYQIARLCQAASSTPAVFALPAINARRSLAPKLLEFYALLERLCNIVGDPSTVNLHASASPTRASSRADSMPADEAAVELSDVQRRDLEEFERLVVANRFSNEETLKQPAVSLIRAVFADAHYFSGLKPIPQYTEAFAYELLFPSWLNLLKACMLPRSDNGKPRLSGTGQGALFEFLGKLDGFTVAELHQLVGLLTFIASRFDAPRCEELLQRLVDLVTQQGTAVIAALDGIDLASKDARELRVRIADYLVVKTSVIATGDRQVATIAYQRPTRRALPEVLSQRLVELEQSQAWTQLFAIARPLAQLICSAEALSPELANFLTAQPNRIDDLIGLLAWQSEAGVWQVLPCEGQACIAALISHQAEQLDATWPQIKQLARTIGPNLRGFNEGPVEFFQRTLINDAAGRKVLLQCAMDEGQRLQLVEQLLAKAGRTDDDARLLNLLCCASIVSGQTEVAAAASGTLQALDAVISNRSIGNRELSDLLGDLQANAPRALELLASPMMAAGGKSPRVAALYLTLNEVAQKFSETGKVDNFSVVRAKFSKLTNMNWDDV